ncbi:MAG TPA: prenyltransferase/squalene oxidase repeat-containing protein [Candidatus Binatia bacterium]|nr:prenyltransferase/squalene oxidase repeat-containing protein [Candidatus Binatia bacterium]
MIDRAISFLLETQNADGGWGAAQGRRSNTEATGLAVLALESFKKSGTSKNAQRGIDWLMERQNADGSWPFNDTSKDGSWSTAIAILSLSLLPEHHGRIIKAARWAIGHEASRLGWLASLLLALSPEKNASRVNLDLKGWPWTAASFSWVEPTSYFLIALKKLRPHLRGTKADERIRQGELMISDRMCEGGGWNYGNSKVLGESLWPYPDMTAVALVALQDHPEAEANRTSLRALQKMLKELDSGLALSWAIICFRLYGYEVTEWKTLLAKKFQKTGFVGETKTIALSLLAWGEGVRFFQI